MPILKESDLRRFKNQFGYSSIKNYTGRRYRMTEGRNTRAVTVFLSHSHTDRDVIEDAITLLSGLGIEVYVDWLDAEMPRVTNAETAMRLKSKIEENRKFVLLASPKAIMSNWVNWELGLGDSHKYIEHIALLPFVRGDDNWKEAEYLQIYPYIQKDYSFSTGTDPLDYQVRFPNSKTVKLKEWLRS